MRKPDSSIRIAITGAGIICSIGRNKEEVWRSIVESRAGIAKLTRFDGETFPTDIAAEVQVERQAFSLSIGGLKARRSTKRLSRTDLLAVVAAKEAVEQASANAPL